MKRTNRKGKQSRARQPAPKQGGSRSRRRRGTTLLDAGELRWDCPPIEPSKRRPDLATLLGQERPLVALETGMLLRAPGYNVFLSGAIGSGRTRWVTDFIQRKKPCGRPVPDRVFVSNFREPNRPRLITLPRCEGQRFREEMRELIHVISESLQSALRSRTHRVSRDLLLRATEEREQRLMTALDRQAQKDGCAVVQFPAPHGGMMADIYPIYDGEPVNPEAFADLVGSGSVHRNEWGRIHTRREVLMERLEQVTDRLLKISRETEAELRRIDQQVAGHVLSAHLRDFRRRWQQDQVGEFLDEMRSHILEDLDRWGRPPEEPPMPQQPATEGQDGPPPPSPLEPPADSPAHRPEPVRYHGVEVHLVKTSAGDECPVVLEIHPTYQNLFGSVEACRDPNSPGLAAVQPGALVRADGGYLILRVSELLQEPSVWPHLKRALKVRQVEMREYDSQAGMPGGMLFPEPVPIDVKVILIGEGGAYETFAAEDPQFLHAFKVHAEFDSAIPQTKANLRRYADLLAWLSDAEGLLLFKPDAAAAVAEHGARLAGQRSRLTARYGELADLAREASFLSAQEGRKTVDRDHVAAALKQRQYRSELFQEHTDRDFHDGYLLLQTKGSVVGQINAMTVMESGSLAFGKPSRITAATGAGPKEGAHFLNIEREAQLSGPIYDKGVMILQGYLLEKFGQKRPLRLSATLCFEQTYNGIDGDSASAAELIAVLSSLSGVPIRQGFAITGAINQKGVMGAVSGVNEKVEGFFRLCEARGLKGDHGVVLPRTNVPDLMLDPKLVDAVKSERFQVHAVESIDEALEVMTGTPAKDVMTRAASTLDRYAGSAGSAEG